MMTKKPILVAALFLTTSISSVTASGDPVVATVNNVQIKKSVFDDAYMQNMMFVTDKVVTKERVLDELINRELGILRARQAKLHEDALVKRKMEDVLYHAQISKDLEPRLAKIVVTDKEVEDYYKKFPEYRTAHILFRVQAVPELEEAKAAQDMAMQVYADLRRNPDKFTELANRYSQSTTAQNGGDIGFQPAVRLAPEYFAAINGKENGYISSPVRSQFGYHIIRVLAKKDFASINTALYKKIVYDIKRDKILEEYFAELRRGASISINKQVLEL
jgi:parvulin-like peptidyl-prolyl isomerase